MLQNKEFLSRLQAAKFDVAYADMAGLCTPGLIHYAKIPGWIWMDNGPLLDFIAYLIGLPNPPSYVPCKLDLYKFYLSKQREFSATAAFFSYIDSMFSIIELSAIQGAYHLYPLTQVYCSFSDTVFGRDGLLATCEELPYLDIFSSVLF